VIKKLFRQAYLRIVTVYSFIKHHY